MKKENKTLISPPAEMPAEYIGIAAKIEAVIESENDIFANFLNVNCGCVARFGYCACTNLEAACRYVSELPPNGAWFNEQQREILRGQILYQAEGGYSEEDVRILNDWNLARAWLETANDYVQSQL